MYTCWWDWGFGYRECFRKQSACRQKTWPPQWLLLGAASTCFSTRYFIFSTPDTTVLVVPQVHGHARVTGMSQMSFCDNRVGRGVIKLHCGDVNEAVYLSLWRCVRFVSGSLVSWGFLKCTLFYIPWRLLYWMCGLSWHLIGFQRWKIRECSDTSCWRIFHLFKLSSSPECLPRWFLTIWCFTYRFADNCVCCTHQKPVRHHYLWFACLYKK